VTNAHLVLQLHESKTEKCNSSKLSGEFTDEETMKA